MAPGFPTLSRVPRRIALPWACALVLAVPLCFTEVAETDAGWHIAIGRLITTSRAIPRTNALSWAWGESPWYPTSWLYDVALAAAAEMPSALGTQLVTAGLLAIALLGLAIACAREGSAWVVPPLALLLAPRTVARPHVASWAALAFALGARSRRERTLCVMLVALAGNFHAGAAFAAAVLALQSIEAWWLSGRDLRDLCIAVLAVLALLANPGFAFNLRYLLLHLHVDEVIRLKEFEAPRFSSQPAFFLLAPVALVPAALRWQKRPALLAATVVFCALGFRTARMTYEAEIVFAPTLAWALALIPRAPLRIAISSAAAVLAIAGYRLDRLVFSTRWDERTLPVRAARFIEAEHLDGRRFNGLRDGGFLEYALPGRLSFVDGRVQAVPPEAWRALQAAESSRAKFQQWLALLDVEWAITTRTKERMSGFRLLDGPAWALVYWDDASEIFVRRDVARLAPLLRFEYRFFRPYGPIVGAVEKLPRADLPGLVAELDRFDRTSPADPFSALVRCGASTRMRAPEAPAICDDALRKAPPVSAGLVARARHLVP